MTFRITGIDPQPFVQLYGLSDSELADRQVIRMQADANPGFPDRVTLRDAQPGQSLLLLNHTHQPAANPYHASHAIFVLEGATEAFDEPGTIPESMAARLLSIRSFDEQDLMLDAVLAECAEVPDTIETLFENPQARYLQAHYALRGCFAATVLRA